MPESAELQQLRSLLLAPEVSALEQVARELEDLQREIQDPGQLAERLRPVITRVLSESDPALRQALIEALTPFLHRAVGENVRLDAAGMIRALAPVSTRAIAAQYVESPGPAARDLAPLMSAAIREQIRGEREAMIDALYPVIGSTISKYLAETLRGLVQNINERIESRLSFRSLWRKLRAWFAGVSEAELLLREAVPGRLEAVFLIQKGSGLVIAQAPDRSRLDPGLLAGMLTAIRSLFNDSMAAGGGTGELDQIDYGESTIVLEAAGYCYLAAVVRGALDPQDRNRMREALADIVQLPGSPAAQFAGDASAVPAEVGNRLRSLLEPPAPAPARHRTPYAFIAVAGIILLAIGIPLLLIWSRQARESRLLDEIRSALATSGLPSYGELGVEIHDGIVHLSGQTANELLRSRAQAIVRSAAPGYETENAIRIPPPPPFPQIVGSSVEAQIALLNRQAGVLLEGTYRDGELVVSGLVPDPGYGQRVAQLFESLPGLGVLDLRVSAGEAEIGRRPLFMRNSAELLPAARAALNAIASLLRDAPWAHIRVVGHSDLLGDNLVNERIAVRRAEAARAALLAGGIAGGRITIDGQPGPPPGLTATTDSLARCVQFFVHPASPGPL